MLASSKGMKLRAVNPLISFVQMAILILLLGLSGSQVDAGSKAKPVGTVNFGGRTYMAYETDESSVVSIVYFDDLLISKGACLRTEGEILRASCWYLGPAPHYLRTSYYKARRKYLDWLRAQLIRKEREVYLMDRVLRMKEPSLRFWINDVNERVREANGRSAAMQDAFLRRLPEFGLLDGLGDM